MTELERYRRTDRAQDVVFAFGALAATHLPGPGLVRLLARLHMTESAVRSTLAKMARLGRLNVERQGRLGVYSLSAPITRRFRQVQGTARLPSWSGSFQGLLHQVPESARWFRDRLTYYASFHGYGTLRPGVLISAHDGQDAVLEQLGTVPADAFVHQVTITPATLRQARRIAASTWDLASIAARSSVITTRVAHLERVDDPTGPTLGGDHGPTADDDPWVVFERWNALYQDVMDVVFADPHLPQELLPPSWPVGTMFAELDRLNAGWGPSLQPILRAEVEDAAPGLARYEQAPWESAGTS